MDSKTSFKVKYLFRQLSIFLPSNIAILWKCQLSFKKMSDEKVL